MSVMLSQMIVEYELRDPFLPEGEYDGWCQDWLQGSLSGDSFWIDLEKEECWQHCREDSSCYQAVYEVGRDSGTQCWIGTNKMTDPPTGWDRPNATNTCYAKAVGIEPVFIREEKFISSTDVVTTSILSDRPVTLHMSGRSYQVTLLTSVLLVTSTGWRMRTPSGWTGAACTTPSPTPSRSLRAAG